MKNGNWQKRFLFFAIVGIWVFWGCTTAENSADDCLSANENPNWQTYLDLRTILEQSGDIIDYNAIMKIHRTIRQTQGPIPHLNTIIAGLILKRHPDTRVDNIILIVSAVAMGNSPYPIQNAGHLFDAILNQRQRLNLWVLAYVSDALGRYPVDLPRGADLADKLEQEADYLLSRIDPSEEYFGYHFLPPPSTDYIRQYLSKIDDQRVRVIERNCYYSLINNSLPEAEIEAALRKLRLQGRPKTEEMTHRPLEYMLHHYNHFFGSAEPKKVPIIEGLGSFSTDNRVPNK